MAAGSRGACGAVPGGNTRARGGVLNEGARRRAQPPLHDGKGSLTLAPGWPPASPQPATEKPYGNTRERLTNGTALAVKCQESRSSKIGIRRQVRRNPQAGTVDARAGLGRGIVIRCGGDWPLAKIQLHLHVLLRHRLSVPWRQATRRALEVNETSSLT